MLKYLLNPYQGGGSDGEDAVDLDVGLCLSLVLVIYGGWGSVSLAQAATLDVPLEYSTIQSAIDAANSGDTVLVDDGTYVENINFLGVCRTLGFVARKVRNISIFPVIFVK